MSGVGIQRPSVECDQYKKTLIRSGYGQNIIPKVNDGVVNSAVKGAMRYGTFKSIYFKKNWYVKVPMVPRSLML